jgi:hypothetical protein
MAALQPRGLAPVPRPDIRAWNFVLGDDAEHQIDFHVMVLDEQEPPPPPARGRRVRGRG